jgi:RimJ/RimL family protein N-acetyltransferase
VNFKALHSDSLTLHLINAENLTAVCNLFGGVPNSAELLAQLTGSYAPRFSDGVRTKYGFYITLNEELAGVTLLGISSWRDSRGYTGADVLPQMRGRGIAPRTKPHLFYLAFELLGLNRVETGCFVSNLSSKRSIEKTAGFRLEGVLREYGVNARGEFEDEYRYAILRRDWLRLYDKSQVEVIA